MSSTWNGSALQTRFAQKYGFNDSTSLARVLEWMNEVQDEICAEHRWPFLKFKMKKQVTSGDQEIDISPQVPTACTLAALAGGSLASGQPCTVKVTFVLFDESGKEINSLESEPSPASNSITPASSDLSLTVTGIPVYSGSSSVKPTTIWRRIYLSQTNGSVAGPYYLASTIQDNSTTTSTITVNPSSTVEPPEYSMVSLMCSEDPVIESTGMRLYDNQLNNILKYDPQLSSSGTPQYYARTGPRKILIYPKPSSTYTLSYWVIRVPARIFADADRAIQLDHALKPVFDAGVSWKGSDYKDSDNAAQRFSLYDRLKSDTKGIIGRTGAQSSTVREVC